MTLVPGVVGAGIPDSQFAQIQAYGDFIAMLLALLAFTLLHYRVKYALLAVWVFVIFGLTDQLHSLYAGSKVGMEIQAQSLWFVVLYGLPFYLLIHILILILLWQNRSKTFQLND